MTLEGTRQIIAQGPALVEFGAARRLAVATARSQNRRRQIALERRVTDHRDDVVLHNRSALGDK